MSSYSDADTHRSNFLENRLKTICFDQLNPKPHDFYLDQSGRTIFFCCLILMALYLKLFCLSAPMISDIYSKEEYFREKLQLEQTNILQQKKEFQQLSDDLEGKRNRINVTCRRCYFLLAQVNPRQIFRILDNNQHVKQEYNETLLPLQLILILLCLLNTLSIMLIFQKAFQLFLLSNLSLVVCFVIYGEFFIQDRPSVFYTLIIALFILLLTIFLLLQVLKTFFIVRHYQTMRTTLTNIQ